MRKSQKRCRRKVLRKQMILHKQKTRGGKLFVLCFFLSMHAQIHTQITHNNQLSIKRLADETIWLLSRTEWKEKRWFFWEFLFSLGFRLILHRNFKIETNWFGWGTLIASCNNMLFHVRLAHSFIFHWFFRLPLFFASLSREKQSDCVFETCERCVYDITIKSLLLAT